MRPVNDREMKKTNFAFEQRTKNIKTEIKYLLLFLLLLFVDVPVTNKSALKKQHKPVVPL